MKSSRLRVALDARPLSHPQAGGFRSYVRSLLRGARERVEQGTDDLQLLLYLDRPLPTVLEQELPAGTEIRILSPNRIAADLLLFQRQLRADRPDLVHGTMNYLPFCGSTPATLTLHDAMGIRRYPWEGKVRPTPRDWAVNRYWYVLTRLSPSRTRRMITVSQGSAQELSLALEVPASRFDVVYNGINMPLPTPGTKRRERVVVMMHSPDGRKNSECIYQAFGDTKNGPADAVSCLEIVCTSEATAERARRAVDQFGIQNCRLLRGLDDQALSDTFAGASAFLWPSRLEGFGLPPLEAMQAGCPVLSADAPAMPEILGNAALYFPPNRPEQLAERLRALLDSPQEQAQLSAAGRERASDFTCLRMMDETMAVWKQAVNPVGGRA